MLVLENAQLDARRIRNQTFETVSGELDLINRTVDIVQELDPDIIVGWDVQLASWGYLSARANTYGADTSFSWIGILSLRYRLGLGRTNIARPQPCSE